MGAIETAVKVGSRLTRVRRRVAGARAADGRHTPAADVFARVKLFIQPGSVNLNREQVGDSTTGDILIWASKSYLALAYEDDEDAAVLAWTSLLVAPPANTNGPPGDRIEWNGRLYEVTREENWDDAGLVADSRYRHYSAAERGPV